MKISTDTPGRCFIWTYLNFQNNLNLTRAKINPHINFKGNPGEAFNFYKTVFGGKFTGICASKIFHLPDFRVSKNANKIMHTALPIGDSLLMANDVPEEMGRVIEKSSKIVISAENRDEADKIFYGLSARGNMEAPIGDSPRETYFGTFREKHSIEWMIEFDPKS